MPFGWLNFATVLILNYFLSLLILLLECRSHRMFQIRGFHDRRVAW